jgi:hypothetical protein
LSKENPPRLPWEPHPEGGFIAYPEGRKEQPERFGRLTPFLTGPPGSYTWAVRYDGQSITDVSGSKQAASDAANEAWPRVIEMAGAAGARSEWERKTLEMIEKVRRGEIDPHHFANQAADYENLMWVMDRIKPRPYGPPIAPALQRLVDALSAEFHRRRRR